MLVGAHEQSTVEVLQESWLEEGAGLCNRLGFLVK